MTITKEDKRLLRSDFKFDPETGDVIGLELHVNMVVLEDGVELSRITVTKDVWPDLNTGERNQQNVAARKQQQLAQTV